MTKPMAMRAVLAMLVWWTGAAVAAKPIKAVPTLTAASDDATKQHARLRKLVPVATLEKAQTAGKAFAGKRAEAMTEGAIADAARKEAAKMDFVSSDIDSLVALVMMEAAKDAEEDLRALLAEMKKVNAEREKLRDAISDLAAKVKTPKKAPAPAYLKKITTAKTANLQIAYPVLPDVSATVCEVKVEAICLDEYRQKADALEELGEELSLKVQTYTDRRAKLLQAISSMLKKVTATSDTTIAKLK